MLGRGEPTGDCAVVFLLMILNLCNDNPELEAWSLNGEEGFGEKIRGASLDMKGVETSSSVPRVT